MTGRNLLIGVSVAVGIVVFGGPSVWSQADDPHAYFDALVARTDFWKGHSLRPRVGEPVSSPYYEHQLKTRKNGGYANSNNEALWVTYSPGTDTDPNRQDAAKVVIPAFRPYDEITAPIAASTSGAEETIALTPGGLANGRALKIDAEIMTVKRIRKSTTMTVIRGQYGTTAMEHAIGALASMSQNSLANQVRLPLDTTDGNGYVFTWDGYWTSSYLSSGLGNHKAFQFTSGKNKIWLEAQTRFDGGPTDSNPPGGIARPVGWDPTVDVASAELRSYQTPNGPAIWTESNGDVMGPGTTDNNPINPKAGAFAIKPNTWTRFWVRIDQRAMDYDLMDFWVADETRDAAQIYSQIPVSVRLGSGDTANSIQKFWLEFNTSSDQYVRGDTRDLIAYVRNFVALTNPDPGEVTVPDPGEVTVTGLLQRPIAGPQPPP